MDKNNYDYLKSLSFLDDEKIKYLTKVTPIDKFLKYTILKFVPDFIYPNHLTVFRLLSVPFIIYFLLTGMHLWAVILFVISAFSDALDGALARTKSRITVWGIIYDPIADKLLISSVAIIAVSVYLSVKIAIAIVTIEIILIASVYLRFGGRIVPAKTVGKIKMILQSFGLGFLLLHVVIENQNESQLLLCAAEYTLYGAIFFGILSLFVYRSI